MPTIIPDKIIRSHRSSITVTIQRDGSVVVSAPKLMPKFLIQKFLDDKSDWIIEKQEEVKKRLPKKEREYIEGEEFLYLGKLYTLKFTNSTEIKVEDDFLLFPTALTFRIKKELTSWYLRQAKEIITKRLEYHAPRMDTSYSSLLFSDTLSKWGSCGPKNDLQFNWKLVMAPLVVLDYVVIHELAHTLEKNHQEGFWKIVAHHTPAYKTHRKWLAQHQGLLRV